MASGYEICEVGTYGDILSELTNKRAALTLGGFFLTAEHLQTVTYIYPAITSYTISTLTRMLCFVICTIHWFVIYIAICTVQQGWKNITITPLVIFIFT